MIFMGMGGNGALGALQPLRSPKNSRTCHELQNEPNHGPKNLVAIGGTQNSSSVTLPVPPGHGGAVPGLGLRCESSSDSVFKNQKNLPWIFPSAPELPSGRGGHSKEGQD